MDYGKEISEDKKSLEERNCMIKKMEQIWDMIKHDTQNWKERIFNSNSFKQLLEYKEFICLDTVNF